MLKAIARFGLWLWVAALKTILKLSLNCLVALAKDRPDPPIPQPHFHPQNDKFSRTSSSTTSSSLVINQIGPVPLAASPLTIQGGLIQSFIQEVRRRIRMVLGLGIAPNSGLDYHIASIHGSRGSLSHLADAEKYCQTEDKSVYRTLKMRYRSSLKKRKEQIIPAGASRPSSPKGTTTLSEHQRPSASSSSLAPPSTKHDAVDFPSVEGGYTRTLSHHSRVRTTSEISELEDKVMPLPVIKTRARRWKSCSNMTSVGSCPGSPPSVQRRRYHSAAPNLPLGSSPIERLKLVKGSEASSFPQSRNLNGPSWPLATITSSHLSEEKRRAFLRLRRQGRQLSDPSGNRILHCSSDGNSTVLERRPALGMKRRRSHEDNLMVAAAVAARSSCCFSSSSSSSSTSTPSSSPPTSSSSCSSSSATTTRKTYYIVNKSSKFLVEQQVIKSAQRGP